ncbi:hypothetical protein EV651_104377 [Kribbella sp. VKM Ac-2571]|uniref:hypothetical protein n=1 Tax=Kribbella sp. VKM Ac-2571 TaxID=2512222 RepID=UPI001060E06F|nr:hypothetical protein [Kribbella sp. VKM Ac-2571]TDO66810.1 hypothetical protein EV651_104377 [Kribbella sp. VKM Ac-2571]
MHAKRWADLSSRQQRLVVAGAVAESVLKAVALADLARRPASQVRGPKPLWALALTLLNSLGAAPIIYWLYGRKTT